MAGSYLLRDSVTTVRRSCWRRLKSMARSYQVLQREILSKLKMKGDSQMKSSSCMRSPLPFLINSQSALLKSSRAAQGFSPWAKRVKSMKSPPLCSANMTRQKPPSYPMVILAARYAQRTNPSKADSAMVSCPGGMRRTGSVRVRQMAESSLICTTSCSQISGAEISLLSMSVFLRCRAWSSCGDDTFSSIRVISPKEVSAEQRVVRPQLPLSVSLRMSVLKVTPRAQTGRNYYMVDYQGYYNTSHQHNRWLAHMGLQLGGYYGKGTGKGVEREFLLGLSGLQESLVWYVWGGMIIKIGKPPFPYSLTGVPETSPFHPSTLPPSTLPFPHCFHSAFSDGHPKTQQFHIIPNHLPSPCFQKNHPRTLFHTPIIILPFFKCAETGQPPFSLFPCVKLYYNRSMKDQHKNKLLEVSSNLWQMLDEQPSPSLQFKSTPQNQKNRGRGEPMMEEKSGNEQKEGGGRLVEVFLVELEQQLAVYAWRMRTNQPLLTANCLELQLRRGDPFIPLSALRSQLIRSSLSPESPVRLRVKTEPSSPLSDLMPLSLSQHLYCLKEAAYGFQQLQSCFGGFDVQGGAIRVAAGGRVKVWWGLPLMSNPRGAGGKADERGVVQGVVQVFQGWRGVSKGFRQFYEEARQAVTFLQLLRTIDAFIQLHKIKIDKRLILKDQQMGIRPQSPRPDIGRVPKFLSPTAISPKPAAGVRLSLGVLPHARRPPFSPPLLVPLQPSSPSPSPQKAQSISLMATTQTRSPRRVNLVRTDKQRKGSDNNFCFTSLRRLEATRENLLQAKTSQICHSPQTMTSLDPGSSLLRNVEQLFAQDELQGLSVSVEMKSRGKGLALYGRRVNQSFINTPPQQ